MGRNKLDPEKSPKKTKTQSKIPSLSKSPARKDSPTRTKSPARTKSKSPARTKIVKGEEEYIPSPSKSVKSRKATPTRTSTRVKSPSRSVKESESSNRSPSKRSPIRRSPARPRLIRVELEKRIEKDSKKTTSTIVLDSDSDDEITLETRTEKPKAAVRGRTRITDTDLDKENDQLRGSSKEFSSFVLTRRSSSRLNQQPPSSHEGAAKVYHLKSQFDPITVTKRIGEFSDDDDVHEKKSSSKEFESYSDAKEHRDFGGTLGALINMILLPIAAIGLYAVCDDNQCSFTQLPNLKKYHNISTFWDNLSTLVLICYLLILTLLSAAPFFGRKVPEMPNKHSNYVYVMNGLFDLGVALITVCVLELRNIPVADFIVNHIFHLLTATILLSVFLSIFVYIRSYYVAVSALNTHVVGKSAFYEFLMGRELNPRLFGHVDLKIVLFRAFLIGGILIDFAYLYKSLGLDLQSLTTGDSKAVTIHPTIIVFVILHTIYLLDPLLFESTWTTTFTQQQEGFGYQQIMILSTATFYHASIIRYICEHDVDLETWKLVLAGVVFAFGYILNRGSDNQKNAFRINPYGPHFSRSESIPTGTGKKLLADGFWGLVRHPNYLGAINTSLSWVFFCWNAPPVVAVALGIIGLFGRTFRLESHCKLKYGAAWDRYCAKVKYALIPKVF